jgi:hypothetical protein
MAAYHRVPARGFDLLSLAALFNRTFDGYAIPLRQTG